MANLILHMERNYTPGVECIKEAKPAVGHRPIYPDWHTTKRTIRQHGPAFVHAENTKTTVLVVPICRTIDIGNDCIRAALGPLLICPDDLLSRAVAFVSEMLPVAGFRLMFRLFQ